MRKIITIAREFGAGGGEIGRRVAKELGIEYYDKDIILRTALADPKLTPEEVRKWDERVPQTFGFAQSLFDFYNKPLDEQLWQAQMDAIREMASHESCVIVGRNSEYILKEFDHCLRVFAHAGFQWRVNRMASDVRQADKARKKSCEHYTKTRYRDAANYDLCINTEKLGIDRAVKFVLEAAENL